MDKTVAEWPPQELQSGPTPQRTADAAVDLDRLVWDQEYRAEMWQFLTKNSDS